MGVGWGYICHWELPVLNNVPFVEFMYFVFTRMPGEVTVGDLGRCCCVPRLLSAMNFLCLLLIQE